VAQLSMDHGVALLTLQTRLLFMCHRVHWSPSCI